MSDKGKKPIRRDAWDTSISTVNKKTPGTTTVKDTTTTIKMTTKATPTSTLVTNEVAEPIKAVGWGPPPSKPVHLATSSYEPKPTKESIHESIHETARVMNEIINETKDTFDSSATSDETPEQIVEDPDVTIYNDFEEMGLKESLLRGITAIGFVKPSTIQTKAIVPITQNRDILAQAQSGTGKTGSFGIGMLQRIDETKRELQGLILAPTHELAKQIHQFITTISEYMNISVQLYIGGTSVRDNITQIKTNPPQIIVGTPGRIYELLFKKILDPSTLRLVVLDEADEMLRRGFLAQVREIYTFVPNTAKMALFSATMPTEVMQIANSILVKPIKILVPQEKVSLQGIKQYYIGLDYEEEKLSAVFFIYGSVTVTKSIIYCNTIMKANWLTKELVKKGHEVCCIHSDMAQRERDAVMRDFRDGSARILISSDLLARGIDIQQISLVINYDLPMDKENYIHRIGRSGRYGRKGFAINLVTPEAQKTFKELQTHYSCKIDPLPNDFNRIIEGK
jgi:translation initiation factor 4A